MSTVPIISPWVFYWLGIVDSLSWFVVTLGIIVALVSLTMFFIELDATDEISKRSVAGIAGGILCILLGVFIPSRETLIQMAIASQATPDNIQTITTIAKEIKDEAKGDVMDILNTIVKEEEK